ncbi:hypothetical protein DBR42_03770 [Pelomonas sp. HMWF004]|nr:hypothetical protein DBR42_03770 [Pelomonas sp. HMWF004]
MATKVIDIRPELQKQRRKKGWTIAEIEQWAAREAGRTQNLGAEEPRDLVSGGDMKKAAEGIDDDEQD